MTRASYLADTSAFARIDKPAVSAVVMPLVARGEVALCAPVAFELGFSARNGNDYDDLMGRVDAFAFAPVTDGDHRRALELQSSMARRGQHRAISLVDALVAAVAESRDLTVLHYDADFELLTDLTGRSHRWVVARGTAD